MPHSIDTNIEDEGVLLLTCMHIACVCKSASALIKARPGDQAKALPA